ncbi:hypothetical protein MBLNU457_g1028t1 [Dothideomycetes sp. NU457]
MAEEQAPTEHSHYQRLDENNTKRKRPAEAQPEDEDGTQPSLKRQLRHTECDSSVKEKNMQEAQQVLQLEGGNGGQKKPRKRASRHISEQALRDMMQRALDTGSLEGLHPTARLEGHSITIDSVNIEVFNTLSALLNDSSVPRPRRLKVDFFKRGPARSAQYGRLIVTMPGILHETFGPFSKDVEQDLVEQKFLPDRFNPRQQIHQTGGAGVMCRPSRHNEKPHTLAPDSSLAILRKDSPFLVVECAHKQKPGQVIKKAEDYICSAAVPVNFVIAIFVETVSSAAVGKLEPGDTVSVSVYIPMVVTTPEGDKRKMTTAIERHEVFPTPATEVLTIRWSDINCGTWREWAALNELDPDSPEPKCTVPMAHLSTLAQNLAGTNADFKLPDSAFRELPGLYGPGSPAPTVTPTEVSLPSNDEKSFGSQSYVPPIRDPSSDL